MNSLLPSAIAQNSVDFNVALTAELDDSLQKEFPDAQPGAAVLVRWHGEVLLEKCYGLANLEKKSPITPTSNFDLASVSKPFTAMAILILADRNQLRLEADVREHIPELPIYDASRPIRVEDLLHHTSGLWDYTECWETNPSALTDLTNDVILRSQRNHKLTFPTGTKFEYCNTNYALLPFVVSRVSKKPFADFLRDEIFQPLGMNRTVLMDDLKVSIPERTTGYRKSNSGWEKTLLDVPAFGDGNVFSNLHDLGRWCEVIEKRSLVRPETWKRAFSAGKLDDGTPTDYGFGWFVRTRNEKPLWFHTGVWNGTRTFLGHWPQDELSIVMLCNTEQIDPKQVSERLVDRILKPTSD